MKEKCIICGSKLNIFSKKTQDGRICNKCKSFIPVSVDVSSSDKEYLGSLINTNKKKCSVFNCTAHYGSLFFDGSKGMLCFSKWQKRGIPLQYGDIYTFSEIDGIHLYCFDVRYIAKKCSCSVGMEIKIDGEQLRYTICKNEPCKYEYKDGYIGVSEPDRVSMLRNIINQAIEDYYCKAKRRLENARKYHYIADEIENKPRSTKSKEWARGVLYLSDNCTPEEIKTQYRKLLHIFHPDINPDVDNSYAQKLNEAYKILKPKK